MIVCRVDAITIFIVFIFRFIRFQYKCWYRISHLFVSPPCDVTRLQPSASEFLIPGLYCIENSNSARRSLQRANGLNGSFNDSIHFKAS
jgi:hypothetical protein